MRAGAVGLDPWRALLADADDRLITEALVEGLEANEVAKAEIFARAIGVTVTEGIAEILEVLGFLEKKRG